MKKIIPYLIVVLISITFNSCSSEDDNENSINSNSIIGKWSLYARFNSDGTNKNIDDCAKESNVTYKKNSTFDSFYYRIIDGECSVNDKDENNKYKIINDILEITLESTNNQGETTVKTKRLKIKFPDSNTLETYKINSDNTVSNSKDVWKKIN